MAQLFASPIRTASHGFHEEPSEQPPAAPRRATRGSAEDVAAKYGIKLMKGPGRVPVPGGKAD